MASERRGRVKRPEAVRALPEGIGSGEGNSRMRQESGMSGRARETPKDELAKLAGVRAATASHLLKLVGAGL